MAEFSTFLLAPTRSLAAKKRRAGVASCPMGRKTRQVYLAQVPELLKARSRWGCFFSRNICRVHVNIRLLFENLTVRLTHFPQMLPSKDYECMAGSRDRAWATTFFV